MNLLADVLDQQVIDCMQRKSGKVDGLALEIREGEPPRVAFLEMGLDVLARRLSRRLEKLVQRFTHGIQIPWSKVAKVEISVELSADITDYSEFTAESWLRDHVVGRIPGSAHRKHQEKHD